MGKVIAPLAKTKVPANTVFDKRLVIECCERFHIHWRNVRLELTPDNWLRFVSTFEQAQANIGMAQAIGRSVPTIAVSAKLFFFKNCVE